MFVVLIATALGVTAGAILFLSLGIGPSGPVTVYTLPEALAHEAATPILLAGGAAGLFVGLALAGVEWARSALRMLLGAYVGALAAMFIYFIGYVTATAPGSLFSAAFFTEAARALSDPSPWLYVLAFTGMMLGVIVERYTWSFRGLLTFVSLGAVVLGYIGYMFFVSLPRVPPDALPLSIVLFVAESFMLAFVLVYAFYPLDTLGRREWERAPGKVPFSKYHVPEVAFHVPIFNEPPEMVKETLRTLMEVDYPEQRYHIMVLDDSTDESMRAPIEAFCREHDIFYLHREDRTGYKAGALNVGLERTPESVDLIAVIDADYQVQPQYLRETVGYFIDNELAFLQTPQNYRNADQNFLTKQYAYADGYFYQTVLPSRNEANAIIFCGTMGIVRKRVLQQIGGWSEDHITEDAELAARILKEGHTSLYLNKPYGAGLIPESFDAYKKQHYRWAFGGGQVLRTHLGTFLRDMTPRQRFDYLAGSIHWFDGIFLTIIALILLAIGVGDLVGARIITHHQTEIWLVGLIPIFLLVEAAVRVQLSLKHHFDLSFLGTLRVMGMWFSVKFSNTKAALLGLAGVDMPFVRTPKGANEAPTRLQAALYSIRMTWLESLMAALLILVGLAFAVMTVIGWRADEVAITRAILSLWLFLYSLAYLSAPLYAYRSHVFDTDEDEAGEEVVEREVPAIAWPNGAAAWALLSVVVVGLGLRLMDPLSSPIIGAEDPYLHMERAWDLVQGKGFDPSYPPGFTLLLAPLALLGPDTFYWTARFLPPLLGVAGIVGVYLLARTGMGEAGALTAAFFIAVMPEHIFRSELLFPTALDLAILPFLALMIVRAQAGHGPSLRWAIFLTGLLAVVHPWIVGLLAPPVAAYLVLTAQPGSRVKVAGVSLLLGAGALAVVMVLPGTWNPVPQFLANAGDKLAVIAANPATLLVLPQHVHLPNMLTLPALVLAALGAVIVVWRRTDIGVLGLAWTGLLLPIVLVDWFDVWFLAHRTVVFMSIGVALLTGIPVEAARDRLSWPSWSKAPAAVAFAVALMLVTLPAASATQTWYRLYDQEDYETWGTVSRMDPSMVVASSWQTRAGYRGLTGQDAVYNPEFFNNSDVRESLLTQHPDLIVIVDNRTEEQGLETAWLDEWEPVVAGGETRAYRAP